MPDTQYARSPSYAKGSALHKLWKVMEAAWSTWVGYNCVAYGAEDCGGRRRAGSMGMGHHSIGCAAMDWGVRFPIRRHWCPRARVYFRLDVVHA